MDAEPFICPITGANSKFFYMTERNCYLYENRIIGKIELGLYAQMMIEDLTKSQKSLLAGYCRNEGFNIEVPIITTELIGALDKLEFPKSFAQKRVHLLKRISKLGNGDERVTRDYDCNEDFPIAYCDGPDLLNRLLKSLLEKGLIECLNPYQAMEHGIYLGVAITDEGESQVLFNPENILSIELNGLISLTGNSKNDERMQTALIQFNENSIEAKKAACAILSSVLEPIREDCKQYLDEKSVEDFFLIVNRFDIRHNKAAIKELIHPEQVEWVFYSLLNSINTYYKLRSRLS